MTIEDFKTNLIDSIEELHRSGNGIVDEIHLETTVHETAVEKFIQNIEIELKVK